MNGPGIGKRGGGFGLVFGITGREPFSKIRKTVKRALALALALAW
jgi:hypothetical protein